MSYVTRRLSSIARHLASVRGILLMVAGFLGAFAIFVGGDSGRRLGVVAVLALTGALILMSDRLSMPARGERPVALSRPVSIPPSSDGAPVYGPTREARDYERRREAVARLERAHAGLVGAQASAGGVPTSVGPIFTVVVRASDNDEALETTLVSLIEQTCSSWEAIVITDPTRSAQRVQAARFANLDRRIAVFAPTRVSGGAGAAQTGIRLARGELVAMVDAGSHLRVSSLNRMLEAFMQGDDGTIGAYTPTIKGASYLEVASLIANLRLGEPLVAVAAGAARGAIGELKGTDSDLWPIYGSLLSRGWAMAPANHVGLFVPGLLQASLWPDRYSALLACLESAPTLANAVNLAKLRLNVALEAAATGDTGTMVRSIEGVPPLPRAVFDRQIDLESMAQELVGKMSDRDVDLLAIDVATATRRAVDARLTSEIPTEAASPTKTADLVFVPQNAAQAREMLEVARETNREAIAFLLLDAATSDQGAASVLSDTEFVLFNDADLLGGLTTSKIVVGYPRDPLVDEILRPAIELGASVYELGTPDDLAVLRVDEGPPQLAEVTSLAAHELLPLLGSSPYEGSATLRISQGPTRTDAAFRRDESMTDLWDDDELRRFYNIHTGERCVIIGNGPSLNLLDLRRLANEYTIGVNGIFYAAEVMGFDLNYYVVEDSMVVNDNLAAIQQYRAGHKFFPSIYRDLISKEANVTFFNLNQSFYLKGSPTYCIPRFSTDGASRFFSGQSVTIVNLQLAYYMGFAEVILIGMDFSYSVPETSKITGNHILSQGDDPNHFHPDYFGKGKVWKDPKLDRVLASYLLAKQMYEADGRRILNATAGGNLQIFQRVEYESLFS